MTSDESKARYHADPEFRKRKLDAQRRYRESHRNQVAECYRQWAERNHDYLLKYRRDWYARRKTGGQFSELV